MTRYLARPALTPLATLTFALALAPQANADTLPYWVTDTMAYASVFTGSPDIVEERRFSDVEAHVDVLFAKADASADAAYATAFSEATGSTGALAHSTYAAARGDAELNGLVAGRYRVSFNYSVLSMDEHLLFGNAAAVGFESEALQVELLGTGAGPFVQDIAFQSCGGPVGCWISFYAWSDSHAVEGIGSGNATIYDIDVVRLPDTPTLPTPLPGTALLTASAVGLLWSRARRGGV